MVKFIIILIIVGIFTILVGFFSYEIELLMFGLSSLMVASISGLCYAIWDSEYQHYHENRDRPILANSHNIKPVPIKNLDTNLIDKFKNQDSLQQALADNNLTETKIIASMRNGSDVVQTTNITVTAEDLNDSAIQVLTTALNKRLIAMRDEDKKTKPVTVKIKE